MLWKRPIVGVRCLLNRCNVGVMVPSHMCNVPFKSTRKFTCVHYILLMPWQHDIEPGVMMEAHLYKQELHHRGEPCTGAFHE